MSVRICPTRILVKRVIARLLRRIFPQQSGRTTRRHLQQFHVACKRPIVPCEPGERQFRIADSGLNPFNPGQDEDFHDLIAERYERTATIITSNLDFTEWGEAFPNKLLGASTLDRLRHAAYRLVLDGKSYRTPRAEPGADKSVLAKGPKTAK